MNGCTERLAPVFTNFFQCQVVDLQVLHAPAQLAPPAITPQHPPMQFAVALRVEPGSRVFETEICNSSGVRYCGLRFIMESNCSARLLLGSRPDRDWRAPILQNLA